MEMNFNLIESKASKLWDFGWFDHSRFEIDGPVGDRQERHVLSQFLNDPIFERSFCESPDPWSAALGRHGPFPIHRMAADWFQSLSLSELASKIRIALADPEFNAPPSDEQRLPVDAWVDAVTVRGDSAFLLDVPNEPDNWVEWAEVWMVFHEFVCVSPDRRELAVAVIGYD